ncbi:hypothetical protein F2Q70_00003950 [Brassica cretica]|uniref:Uncharacterized protein n=1 Tax=Brassica cretica TaxID=69181 RepID=A0A8S9J062_BRACR|nr:hypothetical protein F2Q70_00003950 [Brassica cretica]
MRHRATIDSPPSRSPRATEHAILAVATGDRRRLPHGHHGRPSTPSSRSPRATKVASLAVATGDRRRLPRGRHGRPASPPSRSPRATGVASLAVATGDRHTPSSRSPWATSAASLVVATGDQRHLPRGRQRLRVPRLSRSPRGDQLLVLPGRHGTVGTTLKDNPPVMFKRPIDITVGKLR